VIFLHEPVAVRVLKSLALGLPVLGGGWLETCCALWKIELSGRTVA